MAIVWTVTRRDSRGFTTAGSAVTFTVAVGPRGPVGPAGPNQVSDATTLGTLTEAVADALALLATNAAGDAARKVAITSIVRALLQATTQAQGRAAIGTDAAGDPRPPTSHTHPASAISDSTSVGRAVLTAADAAAARTAIGAGTGADLLSTLLSAEVSVTTGTTLSASAFGKLHVCSGTAADYTVVLPAASGNAGRFIGFRMATGLTRFVTLDGNASETIDGATTRLMWAGETAILLCDGSNWFKIAGRTIPMTCLMVAPLSGACANNTLVKIPISTVLVDNTGRMAATGGVNEIVVRRAGVYLVAGGVHFAHIDSPGRCIAYAEKNADGVIRLNGEQFGSLYPFPQFVGPLTLSVSDSLRLNALQLTNSSNPEYYGSGAGDSSQLSLLEQPSW